MVCKARYITLLQALAGAQSGHRRADSVTSGGGIAASQPSAQLSPAVHGDPLAAATLADASQSVQQRAQDDPARSGIVLQATAGPQQAPVGERPLWDMVGVLSKAPIEQQIAFNIQSFGARTLAAAVEGAAAAHPDRAVQGPHSSATAVAVGIQVRSPLPSLVLQGSRLTLRTRNLQ